MSGAESRKDKGQVTAYRKKLIEVALPLEAINVASAREKSIRHGHPSTLHLWWARRPLAAARAVIFSQMVDDPSSWPEIFKTEAAQEKERQRLFRLIEELVKWENTTNEKVLEQAREEIRKSWRRTCEDNHDHPRAKELFDPDKLPGFHDPFAGGGALPLEAQRLGLEAYASDLNPVAVLINKAMIEIPPRFAGMPPVNPEARANKDLFKREWKGAQGLAEDVRYYGKWMRDEAEKRIGHLYPKIEVTAEMAKGRPNLKPYIGEKLTVIAWLWARTVRSPNPAFAKVDVPLASTFMLSAKEGKEAYVQPVIEDGGYRFTVKMGKPKDMEAVKHGTKSGGSHSNFLCLMSHAPMPFEYLREEAKAGSMGARLMSIVAEGERGRVYLAPTPKQEAIAREAKSEWKPEVEICHWPGRTNVVEYGLTRFGDLFTPRQLVALTTFSDLVQEARERVTRDAVTGGLHSDHARLCSSGKGAEAYADAVSMYLGFAVSKAADRNTSLCVWESQMDRLRGTFGRQALPMTWDYVETNPFAGAGGDIYGTAHSLCEVLDNLLSRGEGRAEQQDAQTQMLTANRMVSTDPPYYDNIGYADLSDFFYVWLRQSLKSVFPDLFTTLAVPKAEELVATPYRHGSKEKAEAFFMDGMTQAMRRLAEQAHPAFPVTIYYAFKQSESESAAGTASTGWETFLDAVIRAGLAISGTWPMRSELATRNIGRGTNALASSIVLVCRQRAADAPVLTHRDFQRVLKAELPAALKQLQHGNVAPVDLQQAAIGPGMAIFTRYACVLEKDDSVMTVHTAYAMIVDALERVLAEQEGECDADTRFALAWFDQYGFENGPFGDADNLARAKNTSVGGIVEAGILKSKAGKARLLRISELPEDWNPEDDARLTVWEAVHYLIRALEKGGESAAAALLKNLPTDVADACRDLAYRLYVTCEHKKWAREAGAYNTLVVAWPQILRQSAERRAPASDQEQLDL